MDISLLHTKSYVNGEWIAANDQKTFKVVNPANGEVVAELADLGASETRIAIEAAHAAFPAWRAVLARERHALLSRWHQLIIEHRKALANILTTEMGKPLREARGEIRYGAAFVQWFAEEAKRIYGDVIPGHGADKRLLAVKQPIGVVGAITPWNFPNAMILRKVAPALAAGCTVVIKPSEETPLSALALVALAEVAGFPKGVLNVITTTDAAAVGHELTSNPLVRKISFTGSTAVGKLLMRQSADTVKKVSLELGGNAPFIVFDDADLDAAVEAAMICKYRNAGQTCICANRFFVQEGIYETFADKFAQAVASQKVGSGMEEGVVIGPLINKKALDKVERLLEDAISKGAEPIIGGKRHALEGTFFEPTVLTQANTNMKLAKEEIFGPIAPLFSFRTEADVIRLANDTNYGLAAYFFARDLGRVWRVAEALEYGMVGVNTGIISTEVAPFGGVKESGIGREGSKYGIDDFVEIKYICMGGIKKGKE